MSPVNESSTVRNRFRRSSTYKQTKILLDDEDRELLERLANERRVSMAEVIRQLLRAAA